MLTMAGGCDREHLTCRRCQQEILQAQVRFITAARLAPRVGFQLRATREALTVLERHRYLRCLRRGGGRELANEYEIGDGPEVTISGINADNVVELQTRYTQNTMHLDASFMPETVHGDAPFRGKNS